MKNSLKTIPAFLLVFAFTNMHAQVKFGPEIGINLSTMTAKSMGISLDPKTLIGFHLGVMADVPLSGPISLQPGILYSAKGSKYKYFSEEASISPGYIEIPVHVAYHLNIEKAQIFVFAGPYFGYGVGGKAKYGSESQSLKFGSGESDDLKPFDVGIDLGAGVNLNGFLVSVQYGLGLANLSPVTTDNTEMKNRVIGISVAYLLGVK
jgi:hypothetical protein